MPRNGGQTHHAGRRLLVASSQGPTSTISPPVAPTGIAIGLAGRVRLVSAQIGRRDRDRQATIELVASRRCRRRAGAATGFTSLVAERAAPLPRAKHEEPENPRGVSFRRTVFIRGAAGFNQADHPGARRLSHLASNFQAWFSRATRFAWAGFHTELWGRRTAVCARRSAE